MELLGYDSDDNDDDDNEEDEDLHGGTYKNVRETNDCNVPVRQRKLKAGN